MVPTPHHRGATRTHCPRMPSSSASAEGLADSWGKYVVDITGVEKQTSWSTLREDSPMPSRPIPGHQLPEARAIRR